MLNMVSAILILNSDDSWLIVNQQKIMRKLFLYIC